MGSEQAIATEKKWDYRSMNMPGNKTKNIKVLDSASIFHLGNYVIVLVLFQNQSSRPGKGSERNNQDDQNDGIG